MENQIGRLMYKINILLGKGRDNGFNRFFPYFLSNFVHTGFAQFVHIRIGSRKLVPIIDDPPALEDEIMVVWGIEATPVSGVAGRPLGLGFYVHCILMAFDMLVSIIQTLHSLLSLFPYQILSYE